MRTRTIRRLHMFVPATILVALAACGGDDTSPDTDTSAGGQHNDADVSFATDMIPHHAQAVEMAEMAQSKAQSQDVIDLAVQIKDAQDPEIKLMTNWLEEWGEPVPETAMDPMSHEDHGEMAEMMSPEDMQRLSSLAGPKFEKLWLSMMTEHHEGAIEMSRVELQEGSSTEVKALAQDIIDAQEEEIARMQEIRAVGGD